jgi:hypothetical protein
MVADALAGKPNEAYDQIVRYSSLGHPDAKPKTKLAREIQDHMLQGYRGRAFFKDEMDREPEAYEYSESGKMLAEIEARQRLFKEMARANAPQGYAPSSISSPFGGVPSFAPRKLTDTDALRDTAAKAYLEQSRSRHASPLADIGREVNNPENFVGSFLTKMGPVLSDAGSLFASSLLDKNKDSKALDALGDAAVRSDGADWNRTNPVLVADRGWRENDALITGMRDAGRNSEGMTSGDTFRSIFGFHVPGVQPAINALMSFGNGLLDGSTLMMGPGASLTKGLATSAAKTGVPGVSNYGKHLVREISSDIAKNPTWVSRAGREMVDEAVFDPGNLANTTYGLITPSEKETNEQFRARVSAESAARKEATRLLEGNSNQIVRPKTNIQKISEPIGSAVGGFIGNLFQ